jgi:hypothetical protein
MCLYLPSCLHHRQTTTERRGPEVNTPASFWDFPGSNLGQEIDYPD